MRNITPTDAAVRDWLDYHGFPDAAAGCFRMLKHERIDRDNPARRIDAADLLRRLRAFSPYVPPKRSV